MPTVHQPPDTPEPPGPHVTPYFMAAVDRAAARLLGLPPESQPA